MAQPWFIRSEMQPAFDGGLMQNRFLIGGFFTVRTKAQRNAIKALNRKMDSTTTTLVLVEANSIIYKLINNPAGDVTTDADWSALNIASNALTPVGNWDADNTTPTLQDTDAAGRTGEFYFVVGAPSATLVTHSGLFDGAPVTVSDGMYIVSVGSSWIVVSNATTWDAIAKPSVITDYVNGIVIAHNHVIDDVTGLQTALDDKYDIDDTADHTIAFNMVPDEAIVEVEFLRNWYYTKTDVDDLLSDLTDLAVNFTDLLDTPSSYSGHGSKAVAVNIAEDGLEFIDFPVTYTTEMAQDAVGAMIASTSTINLTYNDGTPSLSAAIVNGSVVDAQIGAHTSTKISITAKGQLNSTIVYNDQANTYGDGFKQTFNPNGINVGLNIGTHIAAPSSPADADIYYDTTIDDFRGYVNGFWTNFTRPQQKTVPTTSYTLQESDRNYIILFTAATDVTITLPNTLSVDFQAFLVKYGTGDLILDPDGTLNAPENEITIQYTGASVIYQGSNIWTGYGAISAVSGGGGSGVTDGDKGDITVSSSGTVWTIDDDAVTFAKFQNITQNRILGRYTASDGNMQHLIPNGVYIDATSGELRLGNTAGPGVNYDINIDPNASGRDFTIGENVTWDRISLYSDVFELTIPSTLDSSLIFMDDGQFILTFDDTSGTGKVITLSQNLDGVNISSSISVTSFQVGVVSSSNSTGGGAGGGITMTVGSGPEYIVEESGFHFYVGSDNILSITEDGEFSLDGNVGTAGQVLTSAGAGLPPTWETVSVGGGGTVESVTGDGVDNTDPDNPVISYPTPGDIGAATTSSVSTVATDLSNHITDTVDAHAASAISNVAAGNISATTVQAALNELDSEKQTAAQVSSAISTAVIGVQDLFFSAAGMWPRTTGGCNALVVEEMATSLVNVQYLEFPNSGQTFAQFQIVPPRKWNNGTVTACVHWKPSANGSGNVRFGIQLASYRNDDALTGAFGTEVAVTDAFLATADLHTTADSAAITASGTVVDGSLLMCQINRDSAHGSDTLDVGARVIGVTLRFTCDAAIDA